MQDSFYETMSRLVDKIEIGLPGFLFLALPIIAASNTPREYRAAHTTTRETIERPANYQINEQTREANFI
jgi:hypothetical protein